MMVKNNISPEYDAESIAGREAALTVHQPSEAESDDSQNDRIQLAHNLAVTNCVSEMMRLSLTDAPLEDILNTAIEKLVSLSWLRFENKGCIFLADPDGMTLRMVAQHNMPPGIRESCAMISSGFCLCGLAAERREVFFKSCVDADHVACHCGMVDHGHYCFPICNGGKILGVFNPYVRAGHLRDEQEEHILSVFADALAVIIERKRVELALRESKDLAKTLLNASSDAVCLMDRDGTLLALNQALASRFNLPIDQLEGKNLLNMISPELAASRRRINCLAMDSGVPQFYQDMRDNLVLDNRVYPVKAMDGSFSSVATFSRDITEIYKAEAAIRDLVAYQQAIWGNCPVGLAVLDLNWQILEVNPAFAQIYGIKREDLVGKSARILCADQDQFDVSGLRAYSQLQTGKTFNDDVRMVKSDGSEIWVRLTAQMVDVLKPPMGVVWAAEDITGHKNLELDIQRSNEELECFAYVASHDLRQPLRMVNSYLTLIERKLGAEIDDECKTFMNFAINGARRMDRMIVDLLEYSRISRIPSEKTLVSLEALAGFALKNLERTIVEAGAEISIVPPLPQLSGYESELERLLQNLISNALKFRASDRPIHVTLRCQETLKEWVLSVADTGIGIDSKDHSRLFCVFQRLVSPTQYEGNGIGLAACRKIAEHHGGRIWVESTPGQGSTFFVALPKGESGLKQSSLSSG